MTVIFVDRTPRKLEVERFRLILSTYQDGSGMLTPKSILGWMKDNNLKTQPGWRDFERAVALAFGGTALESKHIYDVLISTPDRLYTHAGISCKMRGELRTVRNKGRVTIELSNAAGEFWDTIKSSTGLNEETYYSNPTLVGETLLSTVEKWHTTVTSGGTFAVDLNKSFFLSLQWDERTGYYQMFQFPINLSSFSNLVWSVPYGSRRLIASDSSGVLFEWYPFSGGQLKYYPLANSAIWQTEEFRLEPLPQDLSHVVLNKAASYFPSIWQKLESNY